MRQDTDKEFAQYLLETLAPDLREAGYTATAGDVEDAGHRLLCAAEIVETLTKPKTKNAGRELIKAALELGMSVAVHYEDDYDAALEMQGSENLDLLWDEATACDDATVYFTNQDKQSMGRAYLIHVNDPDETVSDHSATGWVNEWAKLTDYGQNDLKVVPDRDTESGFKAVRPVKDGVW